MDFISFLFGATGFLLILWFAYRITYRLMAKFFRGKAKDVKDIDTKSKRIKEINEQIKTLGINTQLRQNRYKDDMLKSIAEGNINDAKTFQYMIENEVVFLNECLDPLRQELDDILKEVTEKS
jgi:F0F1-type ATP synthase membrane subunit b/b'